MYTGVANGAIISVFVIIFATIHGKPMRLAGDDDGFGDDYIPLENKTGRLVQMFINRRYLNSYPQLVVNATENEYDNGTIWQRRAVQADKILIRSMAHCHYLCMNDCGYAYMLDSPISECLFTESMNEAGYVFIYRTIDESKRAYLALNSRGKTRQTIVNVHDIIDEVEPLSNKAIVQYRTWKHKRLDERHCISFKGLKADLAYKPRRKCRMHKRNELHAAAAGHAGDDDLLLPTKYNNTEYVFNPYVDDESSETHLDKSLDYSWDSLESGVAGIVHGNNNSNDSVGAERIKLPLLPSSAFPTFATAMPDVKNATVMEEASIAKNVYYTDDLDELSIKIMKLDEKDKNEAVVKSVEDLIEMMDKMTIGTQNRQMFFIDKFVINKKCTIN